MYDRLSKIEDRVQVSYVGLGLGNAIISLDDFNWLVQEIKIRGELIKDFQRLRVKYQYERDERIPKLESLIERYEKALLFYGNKENYELWEEAEKADLTGFYSNIDMDSGETARDVFEGWKVEREEV